MTMKCLWDSCSTDENSLCCPHLCRSRAPSERFGGVSRSDHVVQPEPSLGAQPPDSWPRASLRGRWWHLVWRQAAAWLSHPLLGRALAAGPSPWQIKAQTESKQYVAPGVREGLIQPWIVPLPAPRLSPDLCSFVLLPLLWPGWSSFFFFFFFLFWNSLFFLSIYF